MHEFGYSWREMEEMTVAQYEFLIAGLNKMLRQQAEIARRQRRIRR